MNHVRTASETNTRPQTAVTLSYLLRVINPEGLGHICLDDMVLSTQKHILDRVPESCRPKVEKLFHSYVFKYHSFKLPVEVFVKLYEKRSKEKERQNAAASRTPTKPSVSPVGDNPTESRKPTSTTLELRRRLKHLSQERLFITYDNTFKEMVNTADRAGRSVTRTPVGKERTLLRKASEEAELSMKEGSYSGLHQRKVSIRKEQEWEDIKLAQAIAAGKARTRSPALADSELEGTLYSKIRGNQCNQSTTSADETAKSILNSLLHDTSGRRVKGK